MPHIDLANDLPGIVGLMAFRPETAGPLNALAETLLRADNTLGRGEREAIAAHVSHLNECEFCERSHSAFAARQLDGGYDVVDSIKRDPREALVSPRLRALLKIAAAVQRSGREVTEADIRAARNEGASDVEIHDTVLIAAAFCMYNRYVDGLATWAPDAREAYDQMAEGIVEHGYGASLRNASDAAREVGADDQPAAGPPVAKPMTSRTLTLGTTAYPVTLPSIHDARLHVAAVIVTIHVLGQVALDFHVSVPQILAAVLTCAVMEMALTFHREPGARVAGQRAMLTGSGVALILRVPSTRPGDHWTGDHWYVFAGVAAVSLLTKYLIRYRGSHLFNPSNIGLVAAFLVLGSARVEPLDFWWSPLDGPMILAYAVILIGGVLITRRLHLLAAAATFWGGLAAGVGLVAASGHCMVARWAFAPVCGFDFWWVIVTSPEVLIFLFFMLTDPKTVPAGRVGRVAFALVLAIVSTVLVAPQTNEFGTKVAVLGSLVIACAARPLLERLVPAASSDDDDPLQFARRLVTGGTAPALARAAALVAAVALTGVSILAAGGPARGFVDPPAEDVLGRLPGDIDPTTLPSITVAQDVVDWNHEITDEGAQQIVLTLAENLELEHEALRRSDAALLEAVDHGDRLDELRERLEEAAAGTTVAEQYTIDDVRITLVVPFGRQTGLSLGLESHGTVTTETYDHDGNLLPRSSAPFATSFVMGRPTGGRWLNVAVLPLEPS